MMENGHMRESSQNREDLKGFDPRRGHWSARRSSLCSPWHKTTRPQSARTCALSQLSTETKGRIMECVDNVEYIWSEGGEWIIKRCWKSRWLFDAYTWRHAKSLADAHMPIRSIFFCRSEMSASGAKLWTFTTADKCSPQTSEAWKFVIANVHAADRMQLAICEHSFVVSLAFEA